MSTELMQRKNIVTRAPIMYYNIQVAHASSVFDKKGIEREREKRAHDYARKKKTQIYSCAKHSLLN